MTVREMADAAGLNRNSVLRVATQTGLPNFAYAARCIQKALEEKGLVFEVAGEMVSIAFKAGGNKAKHTNRDRPEA